MVYDIIERGLKKTDMTPRVLPRTVIYDPGLTLALPVALSIARSTNAIAHAAESLYAQDSNPVIDSTDEEEIRAAASAADGLFNVALHRSAPIALGDIGMRAQDQDRAADIAVSNPCWNPRPFGATQRGQIRDLLERAPEGVRPD